MNNQITPKDRQCRAIGIKYTVGCVENAQGFLSGGTLRLHWQAGDAKPYVCLDLGPASPGGYPCFRVAAFSCAPLLRCAYADWYDFITDPTYREQGDFHRGSCKYLGPELPVLPALTGKTLESITFSGEVSTVLTAQRAEGSAEATWRSGGANVTDAPAVQGLLGELEMLTLTRCVDYKPTDEAVSLCGFDAPAAQVEAIYHTESGAELSFSLTVGAQTLDGSSRYIRLGGDSTIYETAADSLTNLLAIAANGLEG